MPKLKVILLTQNFRLYSYNGEDVVVIRDFLGEDEVFVPFNGVGDSSLEQDKEKYQYSYEDIISMLQENVKLTNGKKSSYYEIISSLVFEECTMPLLE